MDQIQDWVENALRDADVMAAWIPYLKAFILLALLLLLSFLSFIISKYVIVRFLHKLIIRTSFKWDDLLINFKVFSQLAHIVPALIIKAFAPVVFADFDLILPFILKLTDAYIVIVIMLVIVALLKGIEFFLNNMAVFKEKPLASYFQLTRIIIYIITGILILSILMGRSPIYFVSAFGAMTAIILLIFKDTILGLVASVQISSSDMVRVGDWVEMPKYNADGDVIGMNLNTVKVRNWDKTITTIPTYYFISDSFKNWRGMQESGGRRIKRAIYVNLRSVKFVDPETRERFKRYHLIKDFVTRRQKEIEEYNEEHQVDTSQLINGRRMTNIGVFRHYAEAYLRNHKRIRQDMSLMVRQLPTQDHGLPIEIYCFTSTIVWAEYESIQSDIFDHLLAATQYFDLEIFQVPSGSDVVLAGSQISRLLDQEQK
ncbi:MAG: mechanosensitive ion channel family protein [Cyclobacteriaceae bacterium]